MPPKLHVISEEKRKKQPFLIVDTNSGIKNAVVELLAKELTRHFTVYLLSHKNVPPGVQKVSPLSVHLLDRLYDQVPYTIVFLDEVREKNKVIKILQGINPATQVLLLIPYRVCEQFIDVLLYTQDKDHITVGLVGDLFGASVPSSPLSKLIHQARTFKEITVSSPTSIFPISEEDLVTAIFYILLGIRKRSPFYQLFYSSPQTVLSLAHALRRTEPELALSLSEGKSFIPSKDPKKIQRVLRERLGAPLQDAPGMIGFEKSILLSFPDTEKNGTFSKQKKRPRKRNLKIQKLGRIAKYIGGAFLLYIGVSFFLFLGSVFFYKQGVNSLLAGNLTQAKQSFSISKNLFTVTSNTISFFLPASSVVFPGESSYVAVYQDLVSVTPDMLAVFSKLNTGEVSKGQLQEAFAGAIQFYFLIQRYDAFKNVLQKDLFQKTSTFLPFSQVAFPLLGYHGQKTYLVLFENNNELRPTGGFIGSVGLLTLKNGKVQNIEVHDVYELDGQLKGHVDPPFIISRFLQPHLYLRDSNFSPDFEESASQSAFMYSLESGKKVDGVISIDTEVLKALVDVVGPQQLPGNKTLTAKNVVDVLQNTIQENFFPGSTLKKDVLGTLLNRIMLDLETRKDKQLALLKLLPDLIFQKHILFAFPDNSLQKIFTAAGFSGSLTDNRVQKNILPDFLSVNEANISSNKANEFVKREVVYSALIRPGMLSSDAGITYVNSGKESYDAYLRVITPKNAVIAGISIDGISQKIVPMVTDQKVYQSTTFKPPPGLEVNQETKDDKKFIGFLIHIPPSSTQRIHVLYQNAAIVPNGTFTYSMLYTKQPGTTTYPLTISLSANDSYKLARYHGDMTPTLFDGNVLTDLELTRDVTRIKE